MKIKGFLLALLICISIYSCDSGIDKNRVKENISLICLKENDTVYVKITNKTDSVIYVPKTYDADFTCNDDTLHFETVNKPKYSITYYYRYKSIFPFEFYTTKRINGYKPDTIIQEKKQVYFFNQFRVQEILPIKPGGSYISKIQFNVPKYTNVVQAIYYHRPFLTGDRLNKFDYSFEDFLKFDSLNAKHVYAPILNRYR